MTVSREMPKYRCHKIVWALKIAAIAHHANPDPTGQSAAASYGATITPAEQGYASFDVDGPYVAKHQPKEGGYYVVYDDGYKSFSPASAFESGYAPVGREVRVGVTEAELAAKAVAPRVTPVDIEANIVGETYFTAAEGVLGAYRRHDDVYQGTEPHHPSYSLLTLCVLVLRNGFTVTGESSCASPENFDAEIGRRIARENAVAKMWPLMGYELRSRLAGEQQ